MTRFNNSLEYLYITKTSKSKKKIQKKKHFVRKKLSSTTSVRVNQTKTVFYTIQRASATSSEAAIYFQFAFFFQGKILLFYFFFYEFQEVFGSIKCVFRDSLKVGSRGKSPAVLSNHKRWFLFQLMWLNVLIIIVILHFLFFLLFYQKVFFQEVKRNRYQIPFIIELFYKINECIQIIYH